MFGYDPVLSLNTLMQLKVHYLGNDEIDLSLKALRPFMKSLPINLKKQEKG